MDRFDLVQSFIEQCERATHTDDMKLAFQYALERLGFRYFACGFHVDPLHPRDAIMMLNYPRAWVAAYSEQQLHRIDPVFVRAGRTALPFFWDSREFRIGVRPCQRKMLAEARHFGIAHGYTVPIHSPRSPLPLRASCSIIPDDARSIHRHSYFAVQLMAGHLFESAARLGNVHRPPVEMPHLSRRERECLELVGQGKSDWEISRILGISAHTVHTYVASAMRRFKVSTRQQALVCALAWHQISFGDVLRARPSPDDGASNHKK